MGDVVVDRLADAVRALPDAGDDDARLTRIRALEELKSAVAAAQAEQTAEFAGSRRREARAAGLAQVDVDRAVAAAVGQARRVSPHQARRYVGWSMILTAELPATFAQLAAGRTSEWRAMLIARETAWLSRVHRAQVDAQLAPRVEQLGDRRVEAETRKLAYSLDPAGAVARTALAESERRVTLRPAPDGMTRLAALLPAAQGVAAYTTLGRDADTLIGTGQAGGRSRGQVMADLLATRLTGQAQPTDLPVEINLIITDQALFHAEPGADGSAQAAEQSAEAGEEAAVLLGAGPIPAAQARALIFGPGEHVPRWIRRLYRSPKTGELMQMEAKARCFTPTQRHFIELRAQGVCATPWCDAPIRHADHIQPASAGGRTHVDNGQGMCEACNYTKNATSQQPPSQQPPGNTDSHAPPQAPAA